MLITDYVRTGKAKLEFRPIAFIRPSSERGALGVEAPALQGQMWSLGTLLYRDQGDESDDWLTDDLLEEAAGTSATPSMLRPAPRPRPPG